LQQETAIFRLSLMQLVNIIVTTDAFVANVEQIGILLCCIFVFFPLYVWDKGKFEALFGCAVALFSVKLYFGYHDVHFGI
jgi:hypothetical protein